MAVVIQRFFPFFRIKFACKGGKEYGPQKKNSQMVTLFGLFYVA